MNDIFQGTGAPLSADGFDAAATDLGVHADLPSLWSLLAVETRGFGYLPDRRPKILFERHVFHARTGSLYGSTHPDISNPASGGYAGGAAEYDRLKRAMLLDRRAALESASWGLGQVMGFNASTLGYASVEGMIEAFKGGEDAQLAGCVSFIAAKPALLKAFRMRDWARVAFFYNGKTYAKNRYDQKLADAHARYQQGLPDIEVRAAQARLAYLGLDPGPVDGEIGKRTVSALKRFQASRAAAGETLRTDGQLDDATRAALRAAAGV